MKNKLIELALKLTGLGKLMEKVNGGKTYLGGAVTILSGAAAVLSNVACILNKVLAAEGAGDILEIAKALPDDPCLKALLAGAAAVGLGLSAIGLRHAVKKAVDAPAAV